ncbi:MAG: protein-disulfide reductase DsbD domain-containing protein [Candidatus Cyclobacteriaceae bacterium M2_1C_046]
MNKNQILWFILFLNINIVYAQEASFIKLVGEPEFTISSGDEKEISLVFLIKEGYHIQAAEVKDENLIPSVLSFDSPDEMIIEDPVYPKPIEFRMKDVEESLLVYSDVLEIHTSVKALNSTDRGAYIVNGKLYYQACDDFKCFFPRNFNFKMIINIE